MRKFYVLLLVLPLIACGDGVLERAAEKAEKDAIAASYKAPAHLTCYSGTKEIFNDTVVDVEYQHIGRASLKTSATAHYILVKLSETKRIRISNGTCIERIGG